MYDPKEVIFAPTARCNLACAHCRVARCTEELGIQESLAFLREAAEGGLERVGFSGGEPFLRPDFLGAVVEEAVSLGLLFDRLMTNGDWWRDEAELRAGLGTVYEAGFDGVIGLSFDAWHGQEPPRAARFLEAVFSASGRRDAAELAAVDAPGERFPPPRLQELASLLGGRLEADELGGAILDEAPRPEAADGESLRLPLIRIPYSAAASPDAAEGWSDAGWFVDDFCAGPGQVLYVHPNGSVAVCCGFANESPDLKLGDIGEGLAVLLERARKSFAVKTCYETGLGAYRATLEARGVTFPGRTRDACRFCEHLSRLGLLSGKG